MRDNLPNITSLRFFMALLVVLFHASEFSANRNFAEFPDWTILHRGTEAVFAFFSLSGFLIIRNLYMEKTSSGTVSLKNFYKRRIFRIFPLYYAVLIFGLLYYNFILPQFGFETERLYSVPQALFLGGSFFANILAAYRPGGIIEILWSIAIEEQFYLFVAPLFVLLNPRKIVVTLSIFSILYFAVFHFGEMHFLKKFKMLFYYFSVSGLFAIFKLKKPDFTIPDWIKYLVYALTIFYFFSDRIKDSFSEAGYQLLSTILFPLLILCLIEKPVGFLENKALKYFGKISYGIYMLHAIVLQITGFIVLKYVDVHAVNKEIFLLTYTLANVAVTLFVSHCSYQYFEKKFLSLSKTL